MRLSRNGVPSLVNAPEHLRKVAKAGRARLISPSMAGDQLGSIKSGIAEVGCGGTRRSGYTREGCGGVS